MLFQSIPKDVLKYIILEYLDGPSACAFVQTCLKLSSLLSPAERCIIRFKKADHITLYRRHIAKLQEQRDREIDVIRNKYCSMIQDLSICTVCQSVNCNGKDESCFRASNIIQCKCGHIGEDAVIRPWYRHSSANIPCFKCGTRVNLGVSSMSSDTNGYAYNPYARCIVCKLLCYNCMYKIEQKYHTITFLESVREMLNLFLNKNKNKIK